uniref:Uncharacterized protein n=1 Tax=Favella ehrenbergii TaxID=182087 RepID=A0A7S3I1R3_9SPIT|mmetsp:Transcript_28716/g.35568  ORF Transcript_28716/g.35568 Transcript_28716/m.35568 type:complete len:196 (+) Transcript_28716:973-1560(+)
MMQQEMQPGTGPFLREGESNLNISEIQAQVSSVMTHADVTSHGFGAFHFGNDGNQATEEGQANLQLEELQKVFDLFHTVVETVEEPVPSSSLSRLQARELPRPHGPNSRTGRQTSKKIERKTLKLHCFEEVQIEEVIGKDTCIPHLSIDRSVFFQSYSSDQFEEIFEDLKGHYKRLCDEEPDGGMDDDSQNMSQF